MRRLWLTLALATLAAPLAAQAPTPPTAKAPGTPVPGISTDKKDEAKVADPYKLPDADAKEWKKLASGLETWDVKEGSGDEVKKSATVTIHYTGWLADGTVFDSSRKRGETATFPLDNLIKGWQEGIPGMKTGGVRRLKIPGALAYGEQGRAGKIPPNATLIFEIELFGDPFKLPDLKAKEWKNLDDRGTGIRVWDTVEGTGQAVSAGDTVTIHYTGWLTDGTIFDSTRWSDGKPKRGEPIEFPLASLIKGWQEAVPGMKVGGTRRMELPYQYAYGEGGSAGIPPKSTLIFEIEVRSTKR